MESLIETTDANGRWHVVGSERFEQDAIYHAKRYWKEREGRHPFRVVTMDRTRLRKITNITAED